MTGINKIFLLGELESEPQLIDQPDGTQVLSFQLSTAETLDKGGNDIEVCEHHQVELRGGQAQAGLKMLRKGTKVWIEGKVHTSSSVDERQVKVYTTIIRALHFTLPGRESDFKPGKPLR